MTIMLILGVLRLMKLSLVCIMLKNDQTYFKYLGVLCFLGTTVLRFALLPYYQQIMSHLRITVWENALNRTHRKIVSVKGKIYRSNRSLCPNYAAKLWKETQEACFLQLSQKKNWLDSIASGSLIDFSCEKKPIILKKE